MSFEEPSDVLMVHALVSRRPPHHAAPHRAASPHLMEKLQSDTEVGPETMLTSRSLGSAGKQVQAYIAAMAVLSLTLGP